MPMTISRGMCSLPAKRKIYERYVCSQKEKLILLCVSDLDPAGDTIAADLPESFEQDFGLDNVEAFKVALTIEQVEQYGLAPSMEAKTSSPTYPTFVERYGITDAYELEAMEPANLAMELTLRDRRSHRRRAVQSGTRGRASRRGRTRRHPDALRGFL